MAWSAQAGSDQRSLAVCQLADTYLNDAVASEDRKATEQVFTLYLKDPDMRVRAALAQSLAPSKELPRWLVWGFLQECAAVAAPFYGLSPQLKSADLMAGIARGDDLVSRAIAKRADLPAEVVIALTDGESSAPVLTLLDNAAFDLGPTLLHEIAQRLGDRADIRNALLQRDDLGPITRQTLIAKLSGAMLALVDDRGWAGQASLPNTARDAVNRASIDMVDEDDAAMDAYVAHLIDTQHLSSGLLLRALIEGKQSLVVSAFAQLSGMSARRVCAIMDARRLASFKPLFVKTGLPVASYGLFVAAILAWREADDSDEVLAETISAADHVDAVDGETFALLGRMAAERAGEQAKIYERQLLLAAA